MSKDKLSLLLLLLVLWIWTVIRFKESIKIIEADPVFNPMHGKEMGFIL